MPSPTSQADIVRDVEGLLEAIERTPEVQPSIVGETQELEQTLEEVQGLKAQQEELAARRQESTQKLLKALGRARETAMRVRAVVKGKLGPHNERLVHFRVAPIRRRARKRPEKPPEGKPVSPPPPPTEPVE
jgi:hypothetical protein